MNPYLTEQSPAFAKGFGDLGVVHLWGRLDDLVPLDLAPHHEGVHRSLDVVLTAVPEQVTGPCLIHVAM